MGIVHLLFFPAILSLLYFNPLNGLHSPPPYHNTGAALLTLWVKCVSAERGHGSKSRVHFLGYSLILFWVKSGSDTVRPHPLQQRLAVHRAGGDSKTDLDDLIISAVQPNTVDLQSRIDLRLGEEVRAENCSDFSHIVQSCG